MISSLLISQHTERVTLRRLHYIRSQFPSQCIIESSAKKKKNSSPVFVATGKTFTKIRNGIGPKMGPCGTPTLIGSSEDTLSSTCTICRLQVLWAHGLHLLFFPVWPVYSIDVCLDQLPSISPKICVLSVTAR